MKVRFFPIDPEKPYHLPTYAKPGDAGLDLVATDWGWHDSKAGIAVYSTNLGVEIPEGYVGLIFPRSSISKKDLMLANSVGVIDSGYRGEIKFMFRVFTWDIYRVGDKIGQLIILPYPKIEVVASTKDEVSKTERGEGGFGSTDEPKKPNLDDYGFNRRKEDFDDPEKMERYFEAMTEYENALARNRKHW